jgi:hypothetical protein
MDECMSGIKRSHRRGNTRISGGIVTTNEAADEKLYEDILKTGEHINQKNL